MNTIRLLGAILLAILSACAWRSDFASAQLIPAPPVQMSFRLGCAWYAPTSAVLVLADKVHTGKSSDDDLTTASSVARKSELDGYKDCVTELLALGAPPNVRQPYEDAVRVLSAPVQITDAAIQNAPNSPKAQSVWSIIDEAQRITPPEDGTLLTWLKLAHGRYAVWAFHVGCLEESIRNSKEEEIRPTRRCSAQRGRYLIPRPRPPTPTLPTHSQYRKRA